jgi:hypothetical protein
VLFSLLMVAQLTIDIAAERWRSCDRAADHGGAQLAGGAQEIRI